MRPVQCHCKCTYSKNVRCLIFWWCPFCGSAPFLAHLERGLERFCKGDVVAVTVHTRTAVNWRSGIHYLPPIFAQSLSKCPERESPTHSSTILHFFHVDVDRATSHLSASPMLRPPTPNPRPPSPWPSVRLVFRQRKSHSLHEPCYCCCCCLGDRSGRA